MDVFFCKGGRYHVIQNGYQPVRLQESWSISVAIKERQLLFTENPVVNIDRRFQPYYCCYYYYYYHKNKFDGSDPNRESQKPQNLFSFVSFGLSFKWLLFLFSQDSVFREAGYFNN